MSERETLIAAVDQSEAAQLVTRPRLLELYCGEGGAGVGYHRAGFDVVGIDINDDKADTQKRPRPKPLRAWLRWVVRGVPADAEDA